MLVYVSSPVQARARVERFNARLRSIGAEPTVDWVANPTPAAGTEDDRRARAVGIRSAILRSDAFVLLTGWMSVGAGAHTELGIALGNVPYVIIVGKRSHAGGVMALANAYVSEKFGALDLLHQRLHCSPLPVALRTRWEQEDAERAAGKGQPSASTSSPPPPKPAPVTAPKGAPDAQRAVGGAMKATLVGRHASSPEVIGDYVVLRVPGRASSASFPAGVPAPRTPDEYRLLVGRKQWRTVEPILLADREDRFIADGIPVVEGDAVVLHVSGLTTVATQRGRAKPKVDSKPPSVAAPARTSAPVVEVVRRRPA